MKDRYRSQSFLGPNSERLIDQARIGVVGASGGGSHIIQQLAHIGFQKYVICDRDKGIEDRNLTRLVGATVDDLGKLKTLVARRLVLSLQPKAELQCFPNEWEEHLEELSSCDVIFGCVDSFATRRDLEAFCRRNLIPYIDIGIDVNIVEPEPPRLAGQIILSMPGGPCMHCLGFLTERTLAREAADYGDAGPRPQVVWANGIVASAAIGIAVDLVTDWTRALRRVVYLSYDGNMNTMVPHPRMKYLDLKAPCPHYRLDHAGPPRFRKL